MTDITPPRELVEKWGHDANLSGVPHNNEHWAYEQHIATRAATWGADQELEACCEWLDDYLLAPKSGQLRAARRPKPPSLREQALEALVSINSNFHVYGADIDTIRRALEALPE
jgi:hypothetical protein